MDGLITSTGSWWWLLLVAALLLGTYFLLEFGWRLVHAMRLKAGVRDFVGKWLWRSRIVFEPVAIGILVVVFVIINPLVHGIAIGILIAGAFIHFRNYLSGRMLRLENSLRIGEEITTGEVQGEIIRMGRLGVKLREASGLRHLGYHQLVQQGYVLVSGSETGEFFSLHIRPQKELAAKVVEDELINLFATAPYIDWSFRPEIIPGSAENPDWVAKVQLRDSVHLPELIRLLGEAGYTANSHVTTSS